MSETLGSLLASLRAAFRRLEAALDQPKNEFIRDSAIQRFEFTFEVMWKCLKVHAEEAGVRVYSPRDSLRAAFQLGLVQDDPLWMRMLKDRNLTSHTYSESTAEEIFSHLADYRILIRQLLVALEKHSGD